jgi:hypothetical protein
MTPSRRFAVFRALAIVELVTALGSAIWIFTGAQGAFGLVLLMTLTYTYAAGFVVAVLGVLAKPRQPLMLVSLGVHALIGVLILFTPRIDQWLDQREREEFRRMNVEYPPE